MIYYYVPDHATPSWGNGLMYHHVRLLNQGGLPAAVLHHRAPFRIAWVGLDVPTVYLTDPTFRVDPGDVLVVSELEAGTPALLTLPCRRLVFVQGSFLMFTRLPPGQDYRSLGYEKALVTLPCIQSIVETHFGVQADVVPPFVAPYFFSAPDGGPPAPRARCILTYPKAGYIDAGLPDFDILTRLLARHLKNTAWTVEPLRDLPHREVARRMQSAAFFVNTNTLEGFNGTVPEAMAAGCLTLCYEAYGGQDYLAHERNAFVFPNHYVYPLVDKLLALVAHYDQIQDTLQRMREQAHATARLYTEARTAHALLHCFNTLPAFDAA